MWSPPHWLTTDVSMCDFTQYLEKNTFALGQVVRHQKGTQMFAWVWNWKARVEITFISFYVSFYLPDYDLLKSKTES
jgi:hypothetical protein